MSSISLPTSGSFTVAENRSRALWYVVGVWLVVMTSLASFRERHSSELWETGGMDAQVKFQAVTWLALGGLASFLILTGRADLRLLRRGPLLWYSAYVVVALVSTAWSASPLLTLYRSLQLSVAIVLVASLRDQLVHLYGLIAVYIAVNWFFFLMGLVGLTGGMEWVRGANDVFMPWGGTAEEPWRFASAFGHPSIISVLAGGAAAGLLARAEGRQWRWALPAVLWFLLTTLLTVSRTALAGTVGGVLLAVAGRRMLLPLVVAGGVLIPAALLAPGIGDVSGHYLMRGQTNKEFSSLTGRDVIYKEGWRRAKAAFPWGMGFNSGRAALLNDEGAYVGITHSHNLFLESLVGTGLAGCVLAVLVILSVAGRLWKLAWCPPEGEQGASPLGWELAAVAMPTLAFCILDRGFASDVNPFVLGFLVFLARTETSFRESETEQDAADQNHFVAAGRGHNA